MLTQKMIFVNCVQTIRYDGVYLTFSKKLTDSQLSLPHGCKMWHLHIIIILFTLVIAAILLAN